MRTVAAQPAAFLAAAALGFLAFVSVPWAPTAQAAASKLSFVTGAQTLTASIRSGAITVQLQDTSGLGVKPPSDLTVYLCSSSTAGTFYRTDGTLLGGSGSSVSIPSTGDSASFLYKDDTVGSPTVTVRDESSCAATDTGFTNATQTQSVARGQFVFTTTQTVTAGVLSSAMTVQLRSASGSPVNPFAALPVYLCSTSSTGSFYTTTASLLGGTPPIVTIPTTGNSATFLYKDDTVGSPTITARDEDSCTATDSASGGFVDGTQTQTVARGQLVFTTAAQTVTVGLLSNTMTVQLRNASAFSVNAFTSLSVYLCSTSSTGSFFDTGTPPAALAGTPPSVTIPAGANSVSFLYKDTEVGSPTLTARDESSCAATDSASRGFGDGTQTQTVTAGQLAFTVAPQALTAGIPSDTIAVRLQDSLGNAVPALGNLPVYLCSPSTTGKFFGASGGALTGTPPSVTIPAGGSTASFLYSDPTPGSYTLTARDEDSCSTTNLTSSLADGTLTVTVNQGRLAFTTSSLTLVPDRLSGTITVQLQDSAGKGVRPSSDLPVYLCSTSVTGSFHDTTGNLLSGSPPKATIPTAGNSVSFLYKDTDVGSATITARDEGSCLVGDTGLNTPANFINATLPVTVTTSATPPAVVTPAKLAFTTEERTVPAGALSDPITVQLQDSDGVPSPATAATTLYLCSTSTTGSFHTAGGALLGGGPQSATVPVSASTATFLYKDTAVGSAAIAVRDESSCISTTDPDFTDTGLTNTPEQTVTVGAAVVDRLAFTTVPQAVVPGAFSEPITVQLQNSLGVGVNPTSALEGTFYLCSSSSTGLFFDVDGVELTPKPPKLIIPTTGSTVSFLYKDTKAGSPTLTARDENSCTATKDEKLTNAVQGLGVGGAPATSRLVFTTGAQSLTPGALSGAIFVQLQSASGAAQTPASSLTVYLCSSSSTGSFTDSRGTALTGTPARVVIPTTSSTASFLYKDTTAGSPVLTARDESSCTATDTGAANATQTLTVGTIGSAAAPGRLVFISTAQPLGAGVRSEPITVQLESSSGAPLTPTTSLTLYLCSNRPTGSFADSSGVPLTGTPPTVTIPTTGNSASFTYVDTAVGAYVITAQDESACGASDTSFTDATQVEVVSAGTAARLVFTAQPGDGAPGQPLLVQPQVTVEDSYGNIRTNDDVSTVVVALTDPGGAIRGTAIATVRAGTAMFLDLAVDQPGVYTLTASTSAGPITAESASFSIRAGVTPGAPSVAPPAGAAPVPVLPSSLEPPPNTLTPSWLSDIPIVPVIFDYFGPSAVVNMVMVPVLRSTVFPTDCWSGPNATPEEADNAVLFGRRAPGSMFIYFFLRGQRAYVFDISFGNYCWIDLE